MNIMSKSTEINEIQILRCCSEIEGYKESEAIFQSIFRVFTTVTYQAKKMYLDIYQKITKIKRV